MTVDSVSKLPLLPLLGLVGAIGCSSARLDTQRRRDAEPHTPPRPAVTAVGPAPEGYRALTPTLVVRDVDEAVDFYVKALEATPRFEVEDSEGRVVRAEIDIGDSIVGIDAEDPERPVSSPESLGGTPASLVLYVEDASRAAARALEAGATSTMPVRERFWGDRYGAVLDPFGHAWAFATHVEDLTEAQMRRRAEIAFAEGTSGPDNEPDATRHAWKAIEGVPATRAVPEPYHTVTPSLTVENAAEAIEGYEKAFGAEEHLRIPGPDGSMIHAEVRIGDSILMLADANPAMGSKTPGALGGSPLLLHYDVEDVDAVFARAIASGATPVVSPRKGEWGERYGMLIGPGGYPWSVATRVENPTPQQMRERVPSP